MCVGNCAGVLFLLNVSVCLSLSCTLKHTHAHIHTHIHTLSRVRSLFLPLSFSLSHAHTRTHIGTRTKRDSREATPVRSQSATEKSLFRGQGAGGGGPCAFGDIV